MSKKTQSSEQKAIEYLSLISSIKHNRFHNQRVMFLKKSKETSKSLIRRETMQFQAMLMNFVYSMMGGFLTLLFMYIGYKVFDRLTAFRTSDELAKDNRAVGMVVAGIFVGVGIAIGLVIGLGLN